MNPSLAMPASEHDAADDAGASIDASATALRRIAAGTDAAAGSSRRSSGPSDESGPSTRILDGPNSA